MYIKDMNKQEYSIQIFGSNTCTQLLLLLLLLHFLSYFLISKHKHNIKREEQTKEKSEISFFSLWKSSTSIFSIYFSYMFLTKSTYIRICVAWKYLCSMLIWLLAFLLFMTGVQWAKTDTPTIETIEGMTTWLGNGRKVFVLYCNGDSEFMQMRIGIIRRTRNERLNEWKSDLHFIFQEMKLKSINFIHLFIKFFSFEIEYFYYYYFYY